MSAGGEGRFLIYGLRDPRTQEIRYVGKSARGLERPLEHFPPPKADTTYKAHWLRKLTSIGLVATIVVLEVCDRKEELSSREQFWIAVGRTALRTRFTNLTAGGDGCADPTPETRAKMSAAISAAKNRPGVKALISQQSKEISARPEVRAKKSVGMKEVWLRPGYAAPHNAALKIALNRPGVQDKHSASAKAAHARPDVKKRHRAGLLAAAARPEVLEKRKAGIIKALNNPEVNARLRAAIKEALNRPEVKSKIAAKSRAAWILRKQRPRMLINLLSNKTLGVCARTARRWRQRTNEQRLLPPKSAR